MLRACDARRRDVDAYGAVLFRCCFDGAVLFRGCFLNEGRCMTEAQKLTQALIEEAVAACARTGKSKPLWDTRPVGLGLKIRVSGTHSWVFCFRPKGAGRREPSRTVTIGTWPRVMIEAARAKAMALAGEVAQGHDPAADLRGERTREKRVVSAAIEGYVASIRRRKLAVRPKCAIVRFDKARWRSGLRFIDARR
jgi:hypothetical protein